MQLESVQHINTDVLVIGGGTAGLRAAIAARKHDLNVLLVSESPAGFRNNSAISKATITTTGVWKEAGDSPDAHLEDTINSGRFLNDRQLVVTMTRAIRGQIDDLIEFGVEFRRRDGALLVTKSPGHAYPRQVSATAYRGINITRPMRQYVASAGVKFLEGILITGLLRTDEGIAGAIGIDDRGGVFAINARATVLATGGAGKIYLRTDNAIGSTGDGYVLAYEAGAVLRDMEFVQFYPTALGEQGSRMCMYERFLPAGATLWNSLGEDILKKHGLDAASITRDHLTRTVMKEIADGRGIGDNVLFDFTTIGEEAAKALIRNGLITEDGLRNKLLVAPTVHFFMGGVRTNEGCETGIDGLYAAGEVCGGMHGANRLGGNAIGETLVFGAIAGNRAADSSVGKKQVPAQESLVKTEIERLRKLASGQRRENLNEIEQKLQQIMWLKAGVIRDKKSLEEAIRETGELRQRLASASLSDHRALCHAVKLSNMLIVAGMVSRAALIRTESRGAHYRYDYPEEDNNQWLKTIQISQQSGKMIAEAIPVGK